MMSNVLLGIDRIFEYDKWFKHKRIGLLTNHTGLDSQNNRTADVFMALGYHIQTLFAPEHGYKGIVQDAIIIQDDVDKSGIPIYSLYNEKKGPTEDMLADIDIFVTDMQDIGSRFYTYANTMEKAMVTCGRKDIPFVVLDRPNPVNGNTVEGLFVEEEFQSFVGHAKLPVRHGLTLGELARYFNQMNGTYCDLEVIPLEGWSREMYFSDTGIPFVSPSPNISSLHAVLCYNATCFFEGTNISEGRGTIRPFEWIGAPFIDAEKLSSVLKAKKIDGVNFIPRTTSPMMFDYKGLECNGIELAVTNKDEFKAFTTGLILMDTIMHLFPNDFMWGIYPEVPDKPYIDYLFGSDKWRNKAISLEEALKREKTDVAEFMAIRRDALLYE